jgi:hypothetical protein
MNPVVLLLVVVVLVGWGGVEVGVGVVRVDVHATKREPTWSLLASRPRGYKTGQANKWCYARLWPSRMGGHWLASCIQLSYMEQDC